MNHLLKRALQGAVIAGGIWVVGQGLASADTVQDANTLVGNVISAPADQSVLDGVLTGTSADAPVNAPVVACGNSVGILSAPSSSCPTGTSGGSASGNGSTANAPANAPVSVTGNSVLIGSPIGSGDQNGSTGTGAGTASDSGSNGATAGDSSIDAPVNAPATVCGNSVGLFSEPAGACPDTASGSASSGSTADDGTGSGGVVSDSGLLGTGLLADAGDNTPLLRSFSAQAPVNAPATVCGNTVGVGADPSSGCPSGTGSGTAGATAGDGTDGTDGSTGNTEAFAPVNAPATVCGNGIGILGGGTASCGIAGDSVTNPGGPTDPGTPVNPTVPGGSSDNPIASLLSLASSSLASTGADIRAVLALALALLYTGVTLAMATRKGLAKSS